VQMQPAMCRSCRVAAATCHVWAAAAAAELVHAVLGMSMFGTMLCNQHCSHGVCLKHARSVVGGVGCLAVALVAAGKPC
jgi:hypothetical protein